MKWYTVLTSGFCSVTKGTTTVLLKPLLSGVELRRMETDGVFLVSSCFRYVFLQFCALFLLHQSNFIIMRFIGLRRPLKYLDTEFLPFSYAFHIKTVKVSLSFNAER